MFAPCRCKTPIKREIAFPNCRFQTKIDLEEFDPVIVTQSAKIRALIKLAQRVGASTAPVLLTGESGTGKELFAQLIHDSSARREKLLVRVNCAALPKQLIESELFGHERGSFTDAVANRKGRFEIADQGSLLLDEISEVPLSTQAKLLRVLESNEFERVGSSESIRHDVRIIAASNQDLNEQIRCSLFRLDLYHRINVVQLRIPPLRERREDVPVLAMHFLERFKHESAIELRRIHLNSDAGIGKSSVAGKRTGAAQRDSPRVHFVRQQSDRRVLFGITARGRPRTTDFSSRSRALVANRPGRR